MKTHVALCGLLISTLTVVEGGFLHGNNHGFVSAPISTSSLITTRTFHAGPVVSSLLHSGGGSAGHSLGRTAGISTSYGAGYTAGYTSSGHGAGSGVGSGSSGGHGSSYGTYGAGGPTVSAVSSYGYNGVTTNTRGAAGGHAGYDYSAAYGHGGL